MTSVISIAARASAVLLQMNLDTAAEITRDLESPGNLSKLMDGEGLAAIRQDCLDRASVHLRRMRDAE